MSNPRVRYRFGADTSSLPPLDGKTLLVQFIMNVEVWRFDQKMPRTMTTPPHGVDQIPDVPNFCWAEYGMRVGMARLIDEFSSRGIAIGASINAAVIDVYPQCAEAMLKADWEFIGHGMFQKQIVGEPDERGVIAASLDKLEQFTGSKVRGWLSPGLRQSSDTADHLAACGVEYTFDWNVDDVPCVMATKPTPLIAMPYTQDLNDSIIYAIEHHQTGEFHNRLVRSVEALDHEGGPRVLSMGLHPHLMGVPHRMQEMRKILDFLQSRPNVAFVKPAATIDWFRAHSAA